MDVHQALDWVNALGEECDGGEVSGHVYGVVQHLKTYIYKFHLFINIQHFIYHCTLKISAF